jgi:hypothetical protein
MLACGMRTWFGALPVDVVPGHGTSVLVFGYCIWLYLQQLQTLLVHRCYVCKSDEYSFVSLKFALVTRLFAAYLCRIGEVYGLKTVHAA